MRRILEYMIPLNDTSSEHCLTSYQARWEVQEEDKTFPLVHKLVISANDSHWKVMHRAELERGQLKVIVTQQLVNV